MAKTVFQTGSKISSAFMNGIYGSGAGAAGGHLHDGANDDGHCHKINLAGAAEVQGALPLANMTTHNHTGVNGQPTKVDLAAEVQGKLPWGNVADQIGTIPIIVQNTTLSAAATGNIYYSIRGRLTTIEIPYILGTSISNTLVAHPNGGAGVFNAILPHNWPIYFPIMVVDNNLTYAGCFCFDTDKMTFFKNGVTIDNFGTFATTGYKGFLNTVVTFFNSVT